MKPDHADEVQRLTAEADAKILNYEQAAKTAQTEAVQQALNDRKRQVAQELNDALDLLEGTGMSEEIPANEV